MATFADVKSVRLKIKDPLGFINLLEVATLPETAASQTAYTITDSGIYQEYKSGAWKNINIEISDAQIITYVNLYGVDKAVIQCVKEILMSIGKNMGIVSTSSGTESVQYQSLDAIYTFYKGILSTLKDDINENAGTNTGLFIRTTPPDIGGVRECGRFIW